MNEIETATIEDFSQIWGLYQESWKKWLGEHAGKYYFSQHYIKNRIKEETVYCIKDEDEVIAYITCLEHWNTIHIDDLYVDDKYRRKGLGTKLLNYVIFHSTHLGYETIYTDCDIDKDNVKELNLKLGFKHIGTLKNYWDKDCDFYKLDLWENERCQK